jgi:hypothetical protein
MKFFFNKDCRVDGEGDLSSIFVKQDQNADSVAVAVNYCTDRSRVSDPDPHLFELLDPDPGGQKLPIKIEKKKPNFVFRRAECSLFRAKGFSCSLDVFMKAKGSVHCNF